MALVPFAKQAHQIVGDSGLFGEDWRIVGISGFTVRPPQARREKPKVSAFTSPETLIRSPTKIGIMLVHVRARD